MIEDTSMLVMPKLSPIAGTKYWELLEEWSLLGHTVPEGFTTDLDSVPRIPIVHSILKGRTVVGALLHDYLFATGVVSFKEANNLFNEAMILEGVRKRYRIPIYQATQIAGGRRWKALRKMIDDE